MANAPAAWRKPAWSESPPGHPNFFCGGELVSSFLERVRRVSSVKGSCRLDHPDLRLKFDIWDKVVGGEDAEEYHRLMKAGDVYCPRPGYVKPTT